MQPWLTKEYCNLFNWLLFWSSHWDVTGRIYHPTLLRPLAVGWCEVSGSLKKLQVACLQLHRDMVSVMAVFLGFDSSCWVAVLWKTSLWLLLLVWYLTDKIAGLIIPDRERLKNPATSGAEFFFLNVRDIIEILEFFYIPRALYGFHAFN